ncbi:hypothetical protein P7K49_009353, partial [Saguinus oedipus]
LAARRKGGGCRGNRHPGQRQVGAGGGVAATGKLRQEARPPRRFQHRLSLRPGVGGVAPASPAALKNQGGRATLRARPLTFLTLPAEEPRSAPNMAGGRCGSQLTALLAAWVAAAAATAGPDQAALPAEQSRVQPMTASNWTLVMEGEWMLKL